MALKTNFDKPIYDAMDRGEFRLAARLRAERRMVKALVNAILATGCRVNVHDGEELTLTQSKSRKDIYAALFTTDEDYIYAIRADGTRVARFDLVYGNTGWDVVSDSSANEYADKIWETVITPLSNKIASGA